MKFEDDFQIISTPLEDNNLKVKKKSEKKHNSKKTTLNKVSKKSTKNKEICQLKPKWIDGTEHKESEKQYKCLDIENIVANKQGTITIKSIQIGHSGNSTLKFLRCNDGNLQYPCSKFISFSILHPTRKCMITGSNEGTLCVFKIDGVHNIAVTKPILFEKFPINGGLLMPDGNRVIVFSKRSYYKVFNLTTCETFQGRIEKTSNIRRLEVSPSGDLIVFSDENATIFVVSTVTLNVIHKLHVSGTIRSMSFSHNGKYLYVLEENGKISIFEFKEKGCPVFCRKWFDEGCIKGSRLAISPDDNYVACGSLGVVNVYNLRDAWNTEYPKPVKTVRCPDNRVNQLLFNPSSELLAIGYCLTSDMMRGTFKLLDVISKNLYSNFPANVGVSRPTSFSFSPSGRYFAVGRFNGKVTLFSLNDYDKY